MKKLIINADDFGWSRENVDGIIELFNCGAVSSTSVMATMPAFDYGIRRLSVSGCPGAGVHLTLFDGSPVLPAEQVPSIADPRSGKFLRINMLYRRLRLPKASEVEAEFRAQIERVISAGIQPTHLDVHTTLPYYLPSAYSVILKLNAEYGLPARTLIGLDFIQRSRSLAKRQHLPVCIIRGIGGRLLRDMDKKGIRHPDYFIPDFTGSGRLYTAEEKAGVFRSCIGSLQEGVTELLTHPSSSDAQWRRTEYEVLRDFAPGILAEFPDVKLCSYSGLH